MEAYFRKVEKIDGLLQKTLGFAQHIPEISEKFERMGNKLAELSVQFASISSRVSKMEVRLDRGHDCLHQEFVRDAKERLSSFAVSAVELRERQTKNLDSVRELSSRVNQLETNRRQVMMTLIGSLVTVLTILGSLIWFLSAMSRDVQHEINTRDRQYMELQSRMRRDRDGER